MDTNNTTMLKSELKDHSIRLLNNLCKQWQTEDNCDLVIYSESGAFTVHSCVICAFSIKIASLISKYKTQVDFSRGFPMYSVNVNFSYEALESIVKALYTGVFEPKQSCFSEVVAAVKWLKISCLYKALRKFLQQNPDLAKNLSTGKSAKDSVDNKNKSISSSATSSVITPDLEDLGEDEDDSDDLSLDLTTPIDSDTQSISRKRSKNRDALSKNLVIKLPRIDEVNPEEVETLVKKEVFPTLYDSDISAAEDDANDEDYIPSSLGTSADVTKTGKRSARKRKATPKKISIGKRKPQTKGSPSKKSQKAGKQKRSALKNPKRQKLGVLQAEKLLREKRNKGTGETKPHNENGDPDDGDLEAAVIEEMDMDDPEKMELELLMGKTKYIRCKKCYRKFKDAAAYHDHVQNTPHFDCPDCFFSCIRRCDMTKHINKTHTGMQHLNCTQCDFVGLNQQGLVDHSKEAHGVEKPFKCDHEGCEYRAVRVHYVREHKLTHDKQFMCDKCSMAFASTFLLKSHQKGCYRLQEYLCDLCGQAFNIESSMKVHRQVVHFGEKPYQCKVCSAKFGHHSNLRRHMRIHDNSYPYSCPICNQKFRHTNSLKSHVASKHKDLPEDFDLKLPQAGNLGGISYKRQVKIDDNNTLILGTKPGSNLLKRDIGGPYGTSGTERKTSSPSQMFTTSSVHGEMFMTPADCTFDASNSNDLELVMASSHLSDISKSMDLSTASGVAVEVSGSAFAEGVIGKLASSSSSVQQHIQGPSFQTPGHKSAQSKSPCFSPPSPPLLPVSTPLSALFPITEHHPDKLGLSFPPSRPACSNTQKHMARSSHQAKHKESQKTPQQSVAKLLSMPFHSSKQTGPKQVSNASAQSHTVNPSQTVKAEISSPSRSASNVQHFELGHPVMPSGYSHNLQSNSPHSQGSPTMAYTVLPNPHNKQIPLNFLVSPEHLDHNRLSTVANASARSNLPLSPQVIPPDFNKLAHVFVVKQPQH